MEVSLHKRSVKIKTTSEATQRTLFFILLSDLCLQEQNE